jgi:hypothetical protein
MNNYATMKHIGRDYGLTSHALGKLLKEHGLRTEDGKPTPKAFDIKIVEQKHNGPDHYIWAWHVRKTRMLLERLGHRPKADTSTE